MRLLAIGYNKMTKDVYWEDYRNGLTRERFNNILTVREQKACFNALTDVFADLEMMFSQYHGVLLLKDDKYEKFKDNKLNTIKAKVK